MYLYVVRHGETAENTRSIMQGNMDTVLDEKGKLQAKEAKEELNIEIDLDGITNSYMVLRRNFFEIDGKKLEPYIDYYFEISKYKGTPIIAEPNKCEELIWADINNLPEPFINYEGDFLADKSITTYDCKTDGAYIKKLVK